MTMVFGSCAAWMTGGGGGISPNSTRRMRSEIFFVAIEIHRSSLKLIFHLRLKPKDGSAGKFTAAHITRKLSRCFAHRFSHRRVTPRVLRHKIFVQTEYIVEDLHLAVAVR